MMRINDAVPGQCAVLPRYGDVIRVRRAVGYYHYGIFVNEDCVIHYAPVKDGGRPFDELRDAVVHKTDMRGFMKKDKFYTVCEFGLNHVVKVKKRSNHPLAVLNHAPENAAFLPVWPVSELVQALLSVEYQLFSPEETVARAKSKLGEQKYNLITNNCEHFATWCKTGISGSSQVAFVLKHAVGVSFAQFMYI